MPIDPTRRELLRITGLTGIGALLLGATLIPVGEAAVTPASPPPANIQVDGWLLRASDR